MTGEKNKGTTLEKLWKLDDATLKTPAHDELVLKLLNKEYIFKLIPEIQTLISERRTNILFRKENNNQEEFDFLFSIKHENVWELLNNNILPDEIMKKFIEKYGEYTYSYGNRQKRDEYIGCWWKNVVSEINHLRKNLDEDFREIEIKSEVPINTGRAFIVGYWDIVIKITEYETKGRYFKKEFDNLISRKYKTSYDSDTNSHTVIFYIEVKPKIESFGATLRQLMTYKNYTNSDNIFLFTPDLRFKEAFESQGIKVISPLE